MEKSLLEKYSKMIVVMLALSFNGSARDGVFTVQRTEAKENENGFLGLSYLTLHETPTDTSTYLLSPNICIV